MSRSAKMVFWAFKFHGNGLYTSLTLDFRLFCCSLRIHLKEAYLLAIQQDIYFRYLKELFILTLKTLLTWTLDRWFEAAMTAEGTWTRCPTSLQVIRDQSFQLNISWNQFIDRLELIYDELRRHIVVYWGLKYITLQICHLPSSMIKALIMNVALWFTF